MMELPVNNLRGRVARLKKCLQLFAHHSRLITIAATAFAFIRTRVPKSAKRGWEVELNVRTFIYARSQHFRVHSSDTDKHFIGKEI